MLALKKALRSSIGKKYVMGITGLALVGFMVTHLAGNLALYFPGTDAFNAYTAGLHAWGPLLLVAEIGLGLLFLVHAVMAIWIQADKKKARPGDYYAGLKTKGGPSKMSVFSRNMIISGGVLLIFLVIHVWQFRFGPGIESGYFTMLDGKESRDLYRLVDETFSDPIWVGFYTIVILFFFAHVRHGFWSALQSLGAMRKSWTPVIYGLGLLVALIFLAGFAFIPVYMYLDIGVN